MVCLCGVCLLPSIKTFFTLCCVVWGNSCMMYRHLFITQRACVPIHRGNVIGWDPQMTLCACANTHIFASALWKTYKHSKIHICIFPTLETFLQCRCTHARSYVYKKKVFACIHTLIKKKKGITFGCWHPHRHTHFISSNSNTFPSIVS